MKLNNKIFWLIAIIIIIANILLRFWDISYPNWQIFDEVYYPKYANSYIIHEQYFDVHPPLAKTFMTAGIYFFGNNSLGWRVSEALFGSLLMVVIFLFALSIFKNKIAALFALLIASFSTTLFIESRVGLINIFLVFFSTLSLYLFWLWREKEKTWLLVLSFAACALAASVKWTGFLILPVFLFFILLANLLKDKNIFNLTLPRKFIPSLMISLIVFLGIYIGGFYLANNSQYGFTEWHKQAVGFHQNLTATHPYQSRWWTWPLGIRPIWLEYKKIAEDSYVCMVEIINVPMAWLAIVAFVYAVIQVIRRKKMELLFIIISILFLFIPWAFVKRITFLYLFLPVIPLLVLLDAYVLAKLWVQDRIIYKITASILIILIAGFFIYFYPLMIGKPINYNAYYKHMWLKTWY